jgi:separase
MLDTIQSKFFDPETCDDIQWPLMSADGHPLPRSRSRATRARPRFVGRAFADSDGEDDEPDESETSLKRYWENVRTRYSADSFVHSKLTSSKTDPRLPAHWTVVNIGVTEDGSILFVTRQHAGQEPLIFCVPLKERRESSDDAEPRLTFHDAISELQDIIKSSDEGTRQAVNVRNDDNDAKAAWWAARRDLDRRLKELLDNIEFCWLGGFKVRGHWALTKSYECLKGRI